MLCQLSYRGSLGRKSLAKLRGALFDRLADAPQQLLELDHALRVAAPHLVVELPLDEPLLQAEEELAGGLLLELVGRSRGAQLRDRGDEITVGLAPVDQMGPEPTVEIAVEVPVVERSEVAVDEVGRRRARRQ